MHIKRSHTTSLRSQKDGLDRIATWASTFKERAFEGVRGAVSFCSLESDSLFDSSASSSLPDMATNAIVSRMVGQMVSAPNNCAHNQKIDTPTNDKQLIGGFADALGARRGSSITPSRGRWNGRSASAQYTIFATLTVHPSTQIALSSGHRW